MPTGTLARIASDAVEDETTTVVAEETSLFERERATFITVHWLICLLVPVWCVFDFVLEPELATRFLGVRLGYLALTLVTWAVLARSKSLRGNRIATCIAIGAAGVVVAWMLPQVPDHYLLYTFGFSLVFWGSGIVLLWPPRYQIGTFAGIFVAYVAVHAYGAPVPADKQIGAVFYIATAAVITVAQLSVRWRLERAAFRASAALERRNSELANTVRRLGETQARLLASSAALSDSLDAESIARHVIEVAVPAAATWGVLVGTGPHGDRLVASAHSDPQQAAALADAIALDADRPWGDERKPQPISNARSEDLERVLGPNVAAAVSAHSLMAVPLLVRGERTGTLVLGWGHPRVEPNDAVFCEEIGRRAAIALDNARLFREANEAIGVRDDFIAIASHELRSPLAAITLGVDTQLEMLPADDPRRPAIVRLNRNVRRLHMLVDQLLDVSQLTAGRFELDTRDMDLAALIRDVVAQHADVAKHAGSEIETALPHTLLGRWDSARLERVVSNLIGNAIKYGRGRPIRVALERHGDDVRMTVTDQGIGIAPADHARVFERFERAAATRQPGFGLGLWISRLIVERHGGSIRVDSELDRGATFTIELPLVAPELPTERRRFPSGTLAPRLASAEPREPEPPKRVSSLRSSSRIPRIRST